MPGIESFGGVAGFFTGAFFTAGMVPRALPAPDAGRREGAAFVFSSIIRVIIARCSAGMSAIIAFIMRTIAVSAMTRFLITGSAIMRMCMSIMPAIIAPGMAVIVEPAIGDELLSVAEWLMPAIPLMPCPLSTRAGVPAMPAIFE